jgi:LysM repeat protein
MRNDVKIGIAVGALIIVTCVVFYLSTNNQNSATVAQNSTVDNRPRNVPDPLPRPVARAPIADDARIADALAPTSRPSDVVSRLAPAPSGSASSTLAPAGTSSLTASTTPGEYVVKQGDSFWSIAQTVYGNGKYYNLIVQANAGAEGKPLQPGQKLKIPPAPVAAAPTSMPARSGLSSSAVSPRPTVSSTSRPAAAPSRGPGPVPGRPYFGDVAARP